MFDLTSLGLFARAVEMGSLSKAAQQSHMSLSAASRRIALLEHHFRVSLLNRTPAGVEPTPAGEALARHATDLLLQVDSIYAELSDYAKGAVGRVRVLANTSAMSQDLPERLHDFSQRYPSIKLHISELRSSSILQAVRDGRADVGIVTSPPVAEDLSFATYCIDQLGVVVPEDHPLESEEIDFASLLDYDIVGLDDKAEISKLLVRVAALTGKPIRFRVQVQSFEGMCRLIEAGQGIGILPVGAVRVFRTAMALRIIRLTDEWADRRMSICIRKGAASLPARTLFEFLRMNDPATSDPAP